MAPIRPNKQPGRTRSIRRSGSSINIRRAGRDLEQPGIKSIAANDEPIIIREIGVDRCRSSDEPQTLHMWDIGNTGDLTQGSNTVGEQTLAARFESRMVCFFVEHDRHTLPTQQDREGRTRRPTAHDRDIRCPFHVSFGSPLERQHLGRKTGTQSHHETGVTASGPT